MRATFFTLAFVAMASNALAIEIDIQGSVGAGGEFADYTGLVAGANFGPSSVTDGNMTLAVDGNSPPVGWSLGQSGGTTYVAGSEINYRLGNTSGDEVFSQAEALAEGTYLAINLSTSGVAFDWNSISVDLWRNGAGAASTYQFAYSADAIWDASDFLGSATTVSGTGATGGVPAEIATISFSASDIATGITAGEVRLYAWNNTSFGGNTHLIDVSAQFTPIPEPGVLSLGVIGALGLICLRRRKRSDSH